MHPHKTSAFSVVEVLMAIALIGLLALAAIGPDESAFSGIGDEPLDETLRKAVREARYQAISTGAMVSLSWDAEALDFVIRDVVGTEIERLKSDAHGEKDSVVFSVINVTQGTTAPEGEPDTTPVDRIFFDADRGATPFIARVSYTGDDISVRYDPFSNLKIVTQK